MSTVHQIPALKATTKELSALDADAIVVPCFEDDTLNDEPLLADAVGSELKRAREKALFNGKPFDVLTVVPVGSWKSRRVILIGGGRRQTWSIDRGRRLASAGGLIARSLRFDHVCFVERGETSEKAGVLIQALVEGALFANFNTGAHKTSDNAASFLSAVTIRCKEADPDNAVYLERGRVVGEHTNLARELANAPGNLMTPRMLAKRAEDMASQVGLSIEVLNEDGIAELGMELLLGVARGSNEPPRLIVLKHDPPGAPTKPVLGLVGKGVTFDTGGISLKPADRMERMKYDMSGGAAVIAAMGAIAALGVPIRCIGVVPATENMPGGSALKPGDVLKSADGITVEITNTDAEGRLVLGDGLWYASRCGATHLVDVATLTGASVVALGHTTTGLFGNPQQWIAQVLAAANRAGERTWSMPTFEDYRDLLKSDVADMVNATRGREAGAITAAWFIGAFAGGRPWAHLDIAGTAWAEKAETYQPKGPTGTTVRTLVELAVSSNSLIGGFED
jgi:leucyl aminopeptidase